MLGRLQSLPRVSLGRALTLPRGTVGLRRKPQTPPLGTFSTAQDSRLSRIYLMEPEPFARGTETPSMAASEAPYARTRMTQAPIN